MAELSREEATALVVALRDLVDMADRALPRQSGLTDRVRGHLGVGDEVDQLPNTTASFPMVERANLQLALDALRADAPVWEELGLTPDIGNYGGVSLVGMVAGTWHGPGATGRQYIEAEVDIDETIDCLAAGVILTRLEDVAVALLLYASEQGMSSGLVVEVVAAAAEVPHRFLTRVRTLMDEYNVMRGKVMSFAFGPYGDFGIRFARLSGVTRDDVILDEAVLAAIERHALGITGNVDALRGSGQHVKRGLLLFGPPHRRGCRGVHEGTRSTCHPGPDRRRDRCGRDDRPGRPDPALVTGHRRVASALRVLERPRPDDRPRRKRH